MARAQKLTEQVKTMAAQIKQLETALANAENGSLAPAALGDGQGSLQDEPNAGEYEGELDRVSKFMGSLAITSEGKGHYYGATAGPEVRFIFYDPLPSCTHTAWFTVSATPHARSLSPFLSIARCILLSSLSGRKSEQAVHARSRIPSTWVCPPKFWNSSTHFRSVSRTVAI